MKLALDLTTENFSVMSVGLHRFEADVEIPGRLDAFVAENPAHEFVVAAIVAQNNRCRRVPELVAGDADADIFLNRPGDSDTEAVDGAHGLTHARKQLIVVRRVDEMRAKLPDVAVDQSSTVPRRAEIPKELCF